MNRPKVLMLGWEFPPIVNGGLGVACLGLSKALAKKTELTMILPKADPDFIVENVDLIGLNSVDINKLKKVKTSKKYKEFASVYTVDSNILPYETPKLNILNSLTDSNIETTLDFDLSQMNQFGKGDIYGDDLINKVIDYAKYVTQLAGKIEFDVIHCHDWMTILAGVEIKKLSKKPLVLQIHSLEYDRGGPQSQGWVFQLEKYGMQQADFVVPVSNYTGDVIKEHYKIKSEKIFPVHNGADTVETYREEKPFPDKLVLYLGRITGQKGPQYFLDIATRVIDAYPNVRFVMAGTGDRLKGLIETGAYKRIGNKLHFTGFLSKEKVRHLLAMGDAYVMPSVSEPFGLSALEAAQFGVPCVISKQSGVSEVLNSALKADYWDTELMASHIISLLKDDTLKKKIVQEAYNDLANSTWDASADKVCKVYNMAMAGV